MRAMRVAEMTNKGLTARDLQILARRWERVDYQSLGEAQKTIWKLLDHVKELEGVLRIVAQRGQSTDFEPHAHEVRDWVEWSREVLGWDLERTGEGKRR